MQSKPRIYWNPRIWTSVLVMLPFVAFGADSALAQTAKNTTKSTRSATSKSADRRFADEAASGGMSEVKLGQLAEQKGNSDAVKSFGKRMEDDHSKAGDDLKQVAREEGIQLPEHASRLDQNTYDRLSKLDRKRFDYAYAQAMVKDHEKDVAAFEKEASSGSDPKLKEFASKTLPTLKDHLRQAKEMERTVSSSSSSS